MRVTTPAEAHAAVLPLIDVREQHEWDEGHAAGAIHIPLGQVIERLGELPDGAFGVICHSGGRSARAVEYLESIGLDAANVEGGTERWIAEGLPVDHP